MEWLVEWNAWHWLIGGFVLLIAETLVPGVFLLWWGLAALVIAGVAKVSPDLSLASQAILYAILASALSLFWWKYQHKKDQADEAKSALNQRDHAMLGALGKVQEIVAGDNAQTIARGAFGDTTWRVQGENLQLGDVIKVVAVQGITLQVEKLNNESN